MAYEIDGPFGKFKIPESAHPRTREVCEFLSKQVFDGEYDHPELPSFGQKMSASDGVDTYQSEEFPIIIDIGASWGPFVVWAIAKWPGAMIHAYEPHETVADYILENFYAAESKENPALYLHRMAVTTDPSPRMNGAEDYGAHHIAAAGDTCAWPVKGLHPRDLPECDVLKVDCEGCEVEVLEGYQYLAGCKALLIEWHDLAKKQRVREIAEASGFRCVKETADPATYGVSIWVRA